MADRAYAFPLSLEGLPLPLARQIDLLSDEYERLCRQGSAPDLDALLNRAPLEARDALRAELAAFVAESYWQSGAPIVPEDLAARFGIAAEVIHGWLQVLDRGSTLDPLRDSPTESKRPAEETGGWLRPVEELLLPCRLGEYELLSKLGEGGMGSVYRARHTRLGRDVAVKLIRGDATSSEIVRRFEREMRSIGRLDHPHIVAAEHAGECDGRLFLTMKLLDGTDLGRLVRRVGPLPVADACEAVRQASLGLQYIHEQGLVHRDLKPSNLMLTQASGGRMPPQSADRHRSASEALIQILDLGLARPTLSEPGDDLTQEGAGLGTVDYMAPEQAEQAARVTIAADIYGLGGVLYYLLTGRAPFAHCGSVAARLIAHRTEPPTDLSTLRSDVSPGLSALVTRMLAKAPDDRFAEPRQVADALTSFANGARLADLLHPNAPRVELPPPPTRPTPIPQRRRWPHYALAAALLTAITLGTVAYIRRDTPPRPEIPNIIPPIATPAQVKALRVRHFALRGEFVEARGEIGARGGSFTVGFGDPVTITVEFSDPLYAYLLAFNANGSEQLCWPDAEGENAPPQGNLLDFPRAGEFFYLNDEPQGGLQAFIVVASREPLPAYKEWRKAINDLPWKRLPAAVGLVWRGDGERLESTMSDDDHRGEVKAHDGLAPLAETARRLRAVPGVDAVSVLAFPVLPKREP